MGAGGRPVSSTMRRGRGRLPYGAVEAEFSDVGELVDGGGVELAGGGEDAGGDGEVERSGRGSCGRPGRR